MKKILFLSLLLIGCDQTPDERDLSSMQSPVVVAGKSCQTKVNLYDKEFTACCVLLIDKNGKACVIGADTYMGHALGSRNVGDTIK